jgi:hypothetical protein
MATLTPNNPPSNNNSHNIKYPDNFKKVSEGSYLTITYPMNPEQYLASYYYNDLPIGRGTAAMYSDYFYTIVAKDPDSSNDPKDPNLKIITDSISKIKSINLTDVVVDDDVNFNEDIWGLNPDSSSTLTFQLKGNNNDNVYVILPNGYELNGKGTKTDPYYLNVLPKDPVVDSNSGSVTNVKNTVDIPVTFNHLDLGKEFTYVPNVANNFLYFPPGSKVEVYLVTYIPDLIVPFLTARISTNFVYTLSDGSNENLKEIQTAYSNRVDTTGIASKDHKPHPELISRLLDVRLLNSADAKQPFPLNYTYTDPSNSASIPVKADSVYILTPDHFSLTEKDVEEGPTDPRMKSPTDPKIERPTILLHNYTLTRNYQNYDQVKYEN